MRNYSKNSFSKIFRLHRSNDISSVRHTGKRIYTDIGTFYYINNSVGNGRFCISVNRRTGGSVIRNKIKRWCKETFRTMQNDSFKQIDLLLYINKNQKSLSFCKIKNGFNDFQMKLVT